MDLFVPNFLVPSWNNLQECGFSESAKNLDFNDI